MSGGVGRLVSFALVAASACASLAVADTGAEASRYVDAYGVVDPRTVPEAARAERIFERLRRASGRAVPGARLVVVDSDDRPWAIALADDSVILSRGALDIVYRDGDVERGDAELAFVLGHELAHLGAGDLWHRTMRASLSGDAGDAVLEGLRSTLRDAAFDANAWRERELRADELGYVLASFAGYAVERVLDASGRDGSRETDFLATWVEQTRSAGGQTHFDAAQRSAFLASRLRGVAGELDDFHTGTMLSHFGRHADALVFLEAFRTRFASRQVLSNIGQAHIQLARQAMPIGLAYRFWMPTLLEPDAGLRVPARGLADGLPPKARIALERAVAALEAAVAMDDRDIVSRMNLVVARLYLGQVFHARAIVEEALAISPADVQLLALRALVLLDQEPDVDMWPRAVTILTGLAEADDAPENVVFNLARLLDERERRAAADALWSRLAAVHESLPGPYADIVCARVAESTSCGARVGAGPVDPPAAVAALFPVRPGASLESDDVRERTAGWRRRRERVAELDVTRLEGPDAWVLAFGDAVELARAAPGDEWSIAALERLIGPPRIVMPAAGGRLRGYGRALAIRVRGDGALEIWWSR